MSFGEKRTVELRVELPDDIAAQAEAVQREDPEFLSRVVLYGLTRRSIYRHLREHKDDPLPPEIGESGPPPPRGLSYRNMDAASRATETHNARGEPYTAAEIKAIKEGSGGPFRGGAL